MPRSFRFLAAALAVVPHLLAQSTAPAPTRLAEIVVTPSRFGVADSAAPAAASLTAAELEVLPQVGDDLFRSIARLPGLASDDISARFWVRGAPHSQLLARLDGVDLIEPFHLKDAGGALSIVDPAAIRRLDLATGGFAAEFGDRLAGVLTMETRAPTRARTALNLSLTGLGAASEGVFAGRRGRWLASARRGYPDVALKLAGRDDEISPRYYDLMAKAEYDAAPRHTVSLHALRAGDGLRYRRTNDPTLTSDYGTDTVWARWLADWAGGVRSETVASWSLLTARRDGGGRLDGFPFALTDRRRVSQLALRQDWSAQLDERAIVRAGFEARDGAARYDYALRQQRTAAINGVQTVVTAARDARLRPAGTAAGVFFDAKLEPLPGLVVQPGVRFDRHGHTGDREWSPRLNAALALGRGTLRAAWGGYTQAQGLHELAVADGERTFGRAERAEQRVLGFEHPLGRGVALRVEAYERLGTRGRPRWENLDNAYDLFPEAQSDRVRLAPDLSRARGVELLLAGRASAAFRWNASYALARTEERLAGRWVPRQRDQRHAFHADATYAPDARWAFSAAWQYHTGWPTTDVVYSLSPLANGRRLLVSANGPIYGLRLPDYHRLDLRATRRIALRRGELRVFLDVFNAYDRKNALGYDHRVTVSGAQVTDVREPREQLPLLPSLGASWEF
jgi:outer membrane cobalamin receptor